MLWLRAPAKINLFLRVLAREASGYHQLETLFAGLTFSDELGVASAPSSVSLETSGPPTGPAENNLAYRAAEAFLADARWPSGAAIELKKRIPPGSGLGGGSSDAAAVLKALNRLHPGAVPFGRLMEIGGALGADVPFFLSPSPLALAWGRGDRLLPLPALDPITVVLAIPPFHVSTPGAFASLAEGRKKGGTTALSGLVDPGAFSNWETLAALGQNDFEPVVFGLFPECGQLREALAGAGARMVRLTGSGSALFGFFGDEASASEAILKLAKEFPSVRFLSARTSTADTWAEPWIQEDG